MHTEGKPRLSRLTAILTQLQSRRLLTAREMADKHGVSIRTIYRDIKTLEHSGIPIITEEGRGYSLMEGFNLPPVMFTENEANALVTAEKLVLKNKDQSFFEHYNSAITKIKSTLQYAQKDKVDLLSERVYFFQNEAHQEKSNYLMTIQAGSHHEFSTHPYPISLPTRRPDTTVGRTLCPVQYSGELVVNCLLSIAKRV